MLTLNCVKNIYQVTDQQLDGDMIRRVRLYFKRNGWSEAKRHYGITDYQLGKCLRGMEG